jgi:hypothetical protein
MNIKNTIVKYKNIQKIATLILSLSLISGISAQTTISKTLSKTKISGYLDCNHVQLIEKDTLEYISISFQNMKYSTISDIKSLVFHQDIVRLQLIDDLKKMTEYAKSDDIMTQRKEYSLHKIENSNNIFLTIKSSNIESYTILNKRVIEKLNEWLISIKLPQ